MIDIIVPTYNRPGDIERFVTEIRKQSFADYRVYIVDDHGDEPIVQLIPEDEHFSYTRLDSNKGQAYARNVAIAKGAGDIIVSLDDDAWFEKEDGLAEIAGYFKQYPKLGCLMFDVRAPEEKSLSTIHQLQDGQLIGSHITCGCAYSRAALEQIGGFAGHLHSGAEEADVTMQLIREDYEIRFAKKIPVFHNYTPGNRSKRWYRMLRFNTTRNDLLIAAMRYPAGKLLPYMLGKYLSHVRFSFSKKRDPLMAGLYTIAALPAALWMLPAALKRRNPISSHQFKDWLKTRW
ncbi:MAG: glycosyltransferase family 2 protein [Bacteroidetes bacterium]|nr:glycosyltransferase family 2 protein [Bacteroidota bacterium]